MKTTTIAQLLNKEVDHALGHLIYVVRDGDLVFYVGQSRRDVVERFWEHMQAPSRLGQLIQLNKPRSLQWQADFYTLADCQQFVQQKALFPLQEWQHFDMDMAEQAMIAQMRPVLNRDFNPQPTPLPPGYKGHTLLGQTKPFALDDPQYRPWLNRMSLQGWVYVPDDDGRILWQHPSGIILSDEAVAPYRESGRLPPLD
jgi:predicted GIY-YIG superfamily endonuclease